MLEKIKNHLKMKEELVKDKELSYLEKIEISLERVRREIISLNEYKSRLEKRQQEPYNKIINNLKFAKIDLKRRMEQEK